MSKTRGLVAAVLAYTAWGPLAPLGALLLRDMGPFTLNTVRTAGTLVLFTFVMGPALVARSFMLLGRDVRLWLLGGVGLGFTFGAYLGSILFLEPTIAALLIYFSPMFVAYIARRQLGEARPRLLIPTIALTIVGSALAVLQPTRGIAWERNDVIGLTLGMLGVFGWTFYTIYLKKMGAHYNDRELTLTAFLASGAVFLVGAVFIERFQVSIGADTVANMAVYIVFPSFVSFQLYAMAVRHAGASLTATLLGIEVAATAVFSYFLTGEAFGVDKIVGIGIVLAAVTMFLVDEARKSRAPAPEGDTGQHQQQG